MVWQVYSPTTGALLDTYRFWDDSAVERALQGAWSRAQSWAAAPLTERVALLQRLADRLQQEREVHALRIVTEMGKPIAEARAEIDKCAWVCRWYADQGPAWLEDTAVMTDARRSLVQTRPLGVLLAIMPWNFPYWQVFRCLAPALLVGNVMLLKHAPQVMGVARAIEELVQVSAGGSAWLTALWVDTGAVPGLIADPRVAALTLTGSERAGRAVGAAAGAALKPSVLELGGSNPVLVLDDADVERVADAVAHGRLLNAGQSCIADKRLIVARSRYDQVVEALIARFASWRVGDPMAETTQMGPLVHVAARAQLEDQLGSAQERGAYTLVGGAALPGPGAWFPPTLVAGVCPESPVWVEETFGPLLPVLPFDHEDQALALANASRFGLGASVYSADPERAARCAEHLHVGSVAINTFVRSDPRLPFGGVKASGYGRELAREGLWAFANRKVLWQA